ncbi:hypothetical protein [Exiguobacterium sp. s146]|nr:hypothetical protein [Exiguobacterium sp. s146]
MLANQLFEHWDQYEEVDIIPYTGDSTPDRIFHSYADVHHKGKQVEG